MELYPLHVFLTVANEKSFSRAAEKLFRTQPAVSLALQRLESTLGEKLIERNAKDMVLTDAGRAVLDYARRFENLTAELTNALAELRDNSAGHPRASGPQQAHLCPHLRLRPFRPRAGCRGRFLLGKD